MNCDDDIIKTCRQVWEEMNLATSGGKIVRNFHRSRIQMKGGGYVVETDLFPVDALKAYSAWNLGDEVDEASKKKYFSSHRGGSQGDYREGMPSKINNVIDCLLKFPKSKRAVIAIPNNSHATHTCDDDAKCMREVHFYLIDSSDQDITSAGGNKNSDEEKRQLNATVLMRAQAAEIFPKNIHFVGSLMDRIASQLHVEVGELFYVATVLVSDRS